MSTRGTAALGRRLAAATVLAVMVLATLLVSDAAAKKPPPPPPPPTATCSFSSSTGQTTCVTVSPEVLDHEETPTLPDAACLDVNGDPSTRTQSRVDVVYRTDTTTQTYKGRVPKAQNLISTTTTSTYRTVVGTVVLGDCSDVTAPETSVTGGPSGSTTSTAATFGFESDEPGSTFACSLDGAALDACTSPAGYSGLAIGAHTFTVRATDAAGNVDPSPAARSWQVVAPTPPPEVTITDGPADTTNSPLASFSFSSSQVGSFQCRIDDAAFTACWSPYQAYGLGAGSHTFEVKVTNGNGTATATRSWTIEANLPTCGAEATSFTQLADGTFEVLGTDLDCLQAISHVRSPVSHTCQGGGSYFNNPAFGNGSSWVLSWTDSRVVIDDSVAAGLWSICIGLTGEFDGLQYPDQKLHDYPDFMAGPDPFNVTASGTSSDGLHLTGSVDAASAALPAPFVGATLVADLTHGPVTGSGCVPASGSWSYESADGTLVHLAPMGANFASYCPNAQGGYYFGLAKVVATPGDLLSSSAYNISFTFTYDSTTGRFTSQNYGSLPYTVR